MMVDGGRCGKTDRGLELCKQFVLFDCWLPSALHGFSNDLYICIEAEHQSGDRKLNKNPDSKWF